MYFFTGFHSSDSEPLKLLLPRGIWADVLCAGDLSTQPGCSEEPVPPRGEDHFRRLASLQQFLHFCYCTCKGISWLSVIGILGDVVSMV